MLKKASALLIFLAASAAPQGATGQLSGTVYDPTGARVAMAEITVTNRDTGLERKVTTNDEGDFSAALLPPGRYIVRAAAKGFKTVALEDVIVNITQTTRLNITLEPAAQAEVITIKAEPPLAQSESAQLGRVVDDRPIKQLPLPTRNFQQLLALSPGTYSNLANNTELGRGDATISVNGQRTTSNNVRINGVDANSIGTNSTPNIAVPATDSIQEFIVQTGLYDASQGRNAGGNVEAITKSGSNNFHGNLYEFFRNRALNANDFFLRGAGQPKPVLTRNQFGFTLGGPMRRDRAFFFGSYQGTRERNGASLTNSLTFPIIPIGLRDDNRTAAGLAAAFGLPQSAINPISIAMLQARLPNGKFAIPSPATPSGLTPISAISRFREDQYNINIDYKLSQKNSISGKWFSADNPTEQANFNFAGLGNGPTQLPGFGGKLDIIQRLLSVADTHVFGANVINQARFGFSRIRVTSQPEEPFTAQQFGISSPLGDLFRGMPTIQVVGLFTLGSSAFADQSSRINTFTTNDVLSIASGRHRIRLGGEFKRSQVNFFFNAFTRGFLIFPTFANFLLGQSISIIGSGVFDRALRANDFSAFIQDDLKVSERLSLNLGLRYDFFGNPVEVRGRLGNFLLSQFKSGTPASPALPPNGFVQAGNAKHPIPGVPTVSDTIIENDYNNLGPRLGFAYKLSRGGRLVLRGGYGIYFDRISTRPFNTQILNFPYFVLATALFRPLSNPFAPVPKPSAFPVVPTVPSSLGVPISGLFLDPGIRTPYVQHYSLNLQLELSKNLLLEVGYVGSKGTKLLQVITLNQPVFDPISRQFIPPLGPFLSTQKNVAGGVQQVQTGSNSHYDSLQVSLTKRLSGGLQFLASYTLGKSMDSYSGSAINELAALPGDQKDLRQSRALSDFDRRHRFVLSFIYDLPRVGRSRPIKALFDRWQVAGIVTLQSGLPFSIVDNPNNFIIQRANFAPGFSGSAATAGSVHSKLNRYFNTSAFVPSRQFLVGTTPNPFFMPSAPFGNTGRNILTGPDQRNVDFSAIKFVPIGEAVNLEFRAEFFNLFNSVNFANPNSNIAVPATFGRITATSAGPRVIQFALKLNF
jgi:hypothetical protein